MDRRQGHLAGEITVGKDPEPVARAELALPFANRAARGKTVSVLRRHRRTLGARLPRDEPLSAPGADLEPGVVVLLRQGAEFDALARQLQGNRVCRASAHLGASVLDSPNGISGLVGEPITSLATSTEHPPVQRPDQ